MSGKKIISIIAVTMMMLVTACSNSAAGEPSIKKEDYTLEMAQKYMDDGNYEEAIEIYTALIEIEPNNTDLYMGRAEAYTNVKKYKEASDDYSQVVSLDSKNSEALMKKGVLEYVAGDAENGEKDLKEFSSLTKDSSDDEKEKAYQDVIAYLEKLEIPVSSEEKNDFYTAQVFEMPDGSHLILVKSLNNIFLVRTIAPGESIPDLSIDNAMYYFDWTAYYFWYDYNSGDVYDGEITVDFHEDGTADVYAGDAKYSYPVIKGAGVYDGYLLFGDSPTAENVETDHYVLYGDFEGQGGQHFWGVIIGETHAGNSNLFVPTFH